MKEQTLIQKFEEGQAQRLQNNQMIGELHNAVKQLQELTSGLIKVTRALPCYDEAIEALRAEEDTAAAAAAAAAGLELGDEEE